MSKDMPSTCKAAFTYVLFSFCSLTVVPQPFESAAATRRVPAAPSETKALPISAFVVMLKAKPLQAKFCFTFLMCLASLSWQNSSSHKFRLCSELDAPSLMASGRLSLAGPNLSGCTNWQGIQMFDITRHLVSMSFGACSFWVINKTDNRIKAYESMSKLMMFSSELFSHFVIVSLGHAKTLRHLKVKLRSKPQHLEAANAT